jgi:hypothetical protein
MGGGGRQKELGALLTAAGMEAADAGTWRRLDLNGDGKLLEVELQLVLDEECGPRDVGTHPPGRRGSPDPPCLPACRRACHTPSWNLPPPLPGLRRAFGARCGLYSMFAQMDEETSGYPPGLFSGTIQPPYSLLKTSQLYLMFLMNEETSGCQPGLDSARLRYFRFRGRPLRSAALLVCAAPGQAVCGRRYLSQAELAELDGRGSFKRRRARGLPRARGSCTSIHPKFDTCCSLQASPLTLMSFLDVTTDQRELLCAA